MTTRAGVPADAPTFVATTDAPLDGLPLFPLLEALLLIGFAGIYLAMFAARLRNVSLVPERDPRLGESLAFENM